MDMGMGLVLSPCNWRSWVRCETSMPKNWFFRLHYAGSLICVGHSPQRAMA